MYMDHSKNATGNVAILCLLFVGVLYLCFRSYSLNNPLFSYQRSSSSSDCSRFPSQSYTVKFPIDELEMALEKASTANKTVIIAVVNKAYAEQSVESETTMLDLLVESLWLGEETRQLLNHLLVVAVDQAAYDRCVFKRLHCYKMETEGVDFAGEKIYMSQDFVKMMWRRTLFLLDVLKHGYSFIFTDADVVWLRNPFSKLSQNQSVDLQISTDWFNGDPYSEKNFINTGFYHVRSNNKTIALFDAWYSLKDNSNGKKEQDVLLELLQNGTFRQWDVDPLFLDTLHFSGFCTDSKDIKAVTTVHANCCRSVSAKVTDLKLVLRDWKRYQQDQKRFVGWSPHIACWNSWNNNITTTPA